MTSDKNKKGARQSLSVISGNRIAIEAPQEIPAETYLVMARSVQKGQLLSHDDVVLTKAKIQNRRGYFNKVSDVVGRRVKNRLSVNQVILNRHLEIDWDIKGRKL